jgi:iron complex outermembrane receptor protein
MQAGFEWDATYRFNDQLSIYTLGAYTYAHNQDWDEPLAQITPLEGSLGIRYQRSRWWADLRSRFVAEQNRVSPAFGETTTPGFQTYDLRMGAEILPGLNLGFSVLNILDANYYEHLSWAYRNMPEQGILFEPGRNFALLLKYDF